MDTERQKVDNIFNVNRLFTEACRGYGDYKPEIKEQLLQIKTLSFIEVNFPKFGGVKLDIGLFLMTLFTN